MVADEETRLAEELTRRETTSRGATKREPTGGSVENGRRGMAGRRNKAGRRINPSRNDEQRGNETGANWGVTIGELRAVVVADEEMGVAEELTHRETTSRCNGMGANWGVTIAEKILC